MLNAVKRHNNLFSPQIEPTATEPTLRTTAETNSVQTTFGPHSYTGNPRTKNVGKRPPQNQYTKLRESRSVCVVQVRRSTTLSLWGWIWITCGAPTANSTPNIDSFIGAFHSYLPSSQIFGEGEYQKNKLSQKYLSKTSNPITHIARIHSDILYTLLVGFPYLKPIYQGGIDKEIKGDALNQHTRRGIISSHHPPEVIQTPDKQYIPLHIWKCQNYVLNSSSLGLLFVFIVGENGMHHPPQHSQRTEIAFKIEMYEIRAIQVDLWRRFDMFAVSFERKRGGGRSIGIERGFGALFADDLIRFKKCVFAQRFYGPRGGKGILNLKNYELIL